VYYGVDLIRPGGPLTINLCALHLSTTMPVPGFLSSFTDKAQNALNQSSISQYIPDSLTGPSNPSHGPSTSPTDKSHTLEQIQHQFRQLQQNYS
jgi:hypothetical protein